jgi:hypothetical protein
VCAVERRRRRRRRLARAASTARGGGESGKNLESFAMKSETPRGGLLFIGSKLSVAVLNYSCC